MKGLLIVLLAGAVLSAAKDPFAGKWIWNTKSARYPPLNFKVDLITSNRYRLTFADGNVVTLVADGTEQHAPLGGTISLRQIDGQTWQLIRRHATSRDDLFKILDGGPFLTVTTINTLADKDQCMTVSRWRRAGSGIGLAGDWKLQSVVDHESESAGEMIILPFGRDGLSFLNPAQKSRVDLKFDGNDYESRGPNEPRGITVSGKRLSAHTIRLESKLNGEPNEVIQYQLAPNGRTIAATRRLLRGGNQAITGVYSRQ